MILTVRAIRQLIQFQKPTQEIDFSTSPPSLLPKRTVGRPKKLDRDDARWMKREGWKVLEIAKHFNVTRQAVWCALRNEEV